MSRRQIDPKLACNTIECGWITYKSKIPVDPYLACNTIECGWVTVYKK
ncbi:hypothetical protein HYZ41_01730 [archaeon]|nr:hypothetical protein [archaeon]